jgi:hypothetical protein
MVGCAEAPPLAAIDVCTVLALLFTQDKYVESDAYLDMTALKEAHAMCVAGACMGLGLAFAGTGDAAARHVLLTRLAYFRSLRSTFPDDSKEASGVPSCRPGS